METHPAKSVRARVALHCKLGDDASAHARAGRTPPGSSRRRGGGSGFAGGEAGLHRVEPCSMKGQDPDAPDEDEEDDEDPEGDIDGRDEDEEGSDLFD